MKSLLKTTAMLVLAGVSLNACDSTPNNATISPAVTPVENMRMAPPADETACSNAVSAQAGNRAVVISSTTSEANNQVIIGVGPQMARWRCLVNQGNVVEVMSLTDEGAL